jgi:hypothetical protein
MVARECFSVSLKFNQTKETPGAQKCLNWFALILWMTVPVQGL